MRRGNERGGREERREGDRIRRGREREGREEREERRGGMRSG